MKRYPTEIGIMVLVVISFAFGSVTSTALRNFSFTSSEVVAVRDESAATDFYRVTAYCPCRKCCGKWADGYTASGHKIESGDLIVAAPPDIPFGTRIFIPHYGQAVVQDRGGAITGNRLDVLFATHEEALQWGVKYLKVRTE